MSTCEALLSKVSKYFGWRGVWWLCGKLSIRACYWSTLLIHLPKKGAPPEIHSFDLKNKQTIVYYVIFVSEYLLKFSPQKGNESDTSTPHTCMYFSPSTQLKTAQTYLYGLIFCFSVSTCEALLSKISKYFGWRGLVTMRKTQHNFVYKNKN